MNQDFVDYIKENITDYLPDDLRDEEITIEETFSENGKKAKTLVIGDSDTEGAPRIFLDGFEKDYLNGREMNEILEDIADIRVRAGTMIESDAFDLMSIHDYEAVKPKLAIALCDYNDSKEFLKDKPYTRVANLAITYRINTIEEYLDDVINIQFLNITDDLLDTWHITKGQLHRDALNVETNKRGVTLIPTDEIGKPGVTKIENLYLRQDPLPKEPAIYQLSNNYINNGAGVIMQNGVLDRVGKLLGRDFYILPSSINEVMILPVTPYVTRDQLAEMIVHANEEIVSPDEVLSDKPLYYNRKRRALFSI